MREGIEESTLKMSSYELFNAYSPPLCPCLKSN